MREASPNAGPRPGPREWPTGRYVALWVGVCVGMALLGATAKNYGPELGGPAEAWGWAAVPVVVAVCAVIARRVGNPTAPILCAAMVGVAVAEPANELGQVLGGD